MTPIQAPWDRHVLAGDYWPQLAKLEGGRTVPFNFVCNGNTFVPDDYPFLEDTTPAGIIHDWRFRQGGGWREFHSANAEYYRNLRRLGFPRPFALARWIAVSMGFLHFNWR